MIPWRVIEQSPEYKAANPVKQRLVREMWFNDYGKDIVGEQDFDRAKTEFISGGAGAFTQGEPAQPSLIDKITGNTGPLTPQDSAQAVIEGLDSGLLAPPEESLTADGTGLLDSDMMPAHRAEIPDQLAAAHRWVTVPPPGGPLEAELMQSGQDLSPTESVLARAGDKLYGGYETVMTGLGGLVGGGAGMLAGLGALAAGKDIKTVRKAQEEASRALTPMPRTRTGVEGAQALGKAMEILFKPAKWAGEEWSKQGNPKQGWVIEQVVGMELLRNLFNLAPELPGAVEAVKSSTAWRRMTIKERSAVTSVFADYIKKHPENAQEFARALQEHPDVAEFAKLVKANGWRPTQETGPGAGPSAAGPAPGQEPSAEAPAASGPGASTSPGPVLSKIQGTPEVPLIGNTGGRTPASPGAEAQGPTSAQGQGGAAGGMAKKLGGFSPPVSEGSAEQRPPASPPEERTTWIDKLRQKQASKQLPPPVKKKAVGRDGAVYAGREKQPVQYEVVEADDLIPSHASDTFQRRPDYPEGVQERAYHRDKEEQLKVIEHAQKLKTIYLLTNNPDAVNGPPIVLDNGVVIGGNSRAMTIQRAYNGKKGAKYKRKLVQFADQFGIRPEDLADFQKPVLVRRLTGVTDLTTKGLHRLASLMNQTPTQAMDEATQTASRGANVSYKTLERIGDVITAKDSTLREMLSKPDGIAILDKLIEDGVIAKTDRSQYINKRYNQLNQSGKDVVEKTVLGSIITDADVLDAAPKSYVNKVARALTPLAKLKARKGEGWDITGDMQRAFELAIDAKEAGLSVEEFLKQGSLFGDGARAYNSREATLANALDRLSSVKLAGKLKEFAAVAATDTKGQRFMFGRPDPGAEFRRIFSSELLEGTTTTAPAGNVAENTVSFGGKIYRGELGELSPQAIISHFGGKYGKGGYYTIDTVSDFSVSKKFKTAQEAVSYLEERGFKVKKWSKDGYGADFVTMEHINTKKAKKLSDKRIKVLKNQGVPVFARYGKPPKSGRSKNFADGTLESGVSVFRATLLPDGRILMEPGGNHEMGSMLSLRASRTPYVIEGKMIGVGSDGEPVLKNARVITIDEAVNKYFKEGAALKESTPGAEYEAGVHEAPVDALVPMEKKLNPLKAARSRVYYRQVKAGERAPRKPILGVLRSDGKIAVVDGNTTLDTMRRAGEKTIPVEIKKQAKQPPDVPADLGAIYQAAKDASGAFKAQVEYAAKVLGGRAIFRPGLKDRARAMEKAREAGDPRIVKDILAATIELPNVEAIQRAKEKLDDLFSVLQIKDKYANPQVDGYRDVSINIVLPNRHVAEVQLNIPEMILAKESAGHKIYEDVRTLDKEHPLSAMARDVSRKLYDGVLERVQDGHPEASVRALSSEILNEWRRLAAERETGSSPSGVSRKASPDITSSPTTLKGASSSSKKKTAIEKTSFEENIETTREKVKAAVSERPEYFKPVEQVASEAKAAGKPVQLDLISFIKAAGEMSAEQKTPWEVGKGVIRHVTTGSIPAGSLKVKNADEVATLMAPLRKEPQEVAALVITDKNGDLLQVHKFSKGLIANSQIDLVQMAGVVINTPRAAKAYFVHNHPSGSVSPSKVSEVSRERGGGADTEMAYILSRMLALRDIGLENIIIGGTRYSVFKGKKPLSAHGKITPTVRKLWAPVKERRLRAGREPGPRLANAVDAYNFLKEEGFLDKEGFIVADQKVRPVAVLEFVPGKYKPADLAADILSVMEKTNAYGVLPFFKRSVFGKIRKRTVEALQSLHELILGTGHLMPNEIVVSDSSEAGSGYHGAPLGAPARTHVFESANAAREMKLNQATLYSGLAAIPTRVLAGAGAGALHGMMWTGPPGAAVGAAVGAALEFVGTPFWDKFLMKYAPDMLEKIPVVGGGVKSVRRALDVRYRGDLEDKDEYLRAWKITRLKTEKGFDYAIDLGRRLSNMPEDAQLRMGEAIRGEIDPDTLAPTERKLAREAINVMAFLGKQYADLGFISEETFFRHVGRYMPRLYTSKEYKSLLKRYNVDSGPRIGGERAKRRKDIDKAIRDQMGEILTPGYPIAKGIVQLTRDIELARLFDKIASNPQWAFQPKPPADVIRKVRDIIDDVRRHHPSLDLANIAQAVDNMFPDLRVYVHNGKTGRRIRIEMAGNPPDNFVKLDDNKRLGRLDGAWVHPEIAPDLKAAIRPQADWERVWNKWLTRWKVGKVIWSPKTHFRNLLTNYTLMHMGGLPLYKQPKYLSSAIKEMRNKGQFYQEAKDWGLMSGTFVHAELRELYDLVQAQLTGVRAGSWEDAVGAIGAVVSKLRLANNKLARVYELEEQWGKMALFIYGREKLGMTPEQAAEYANKWLFDYNDLTRFQRAYRRNPMGAPFATFTFKAIPRVLETSIKTPHRMFLPQLILFGLGTAAMSVVGDDRKRLQAKKKLRPDWMQGSYLGSPNFQRWPFIDQYGREHWWNLTYSTPWGDIGESGGFLGIPGGVMPFSQPFTKEIIQQATNFDWFWKDQIVKDKKLAGKEGAEKIYANIKARAAHLLYSLAPTPALDANKIYAAVRGLPDRRGRYRATGIVLADVIAGVKIYPVDYTEQFQRKLYKLNPAYGDLAKQLRSDLRSLYIKRLVMKENGQDISDIDKQIQDIEKQFAGLSVEVMKLAQTYSQSLGGGYSMESSPPKTGPRKAQKPTWLKRLRERTN